MSVVGWTCSVGKDEEFGGVDLQCGEAGADREFRAQESVVGLLCPAQRPPICLCEYVCAYVFIHKQVW